MESTIATMAEQDLQISATIELETGRLKRFIRSRVPDANEAEDILQDVFFEFIEAYRLPVAIEQVGAWLFRVARNRITDRFRKKREVALSLDMGDADDESWLEQVLPSDDGPEAAYARQVLLQQVYAALEQLPSAQREVFIAHELEGHSFKQMAQDSGVGVNTLLARKRYAVQFLRTQLQTVYDEFNL